MGHEHHHKVNPPRPDIFMSAHGSMMPRRPKQQWPLPLPKTPLLKGQSCFWALPTALSASAPVISGQGHLPPERELGLWGARVDLTCRNTLEYSGISRCFQRVSSCLKT